LNIEEAEGAVAEAEEAAEAALKSDAGFIEGANDGTGSSEWL
jgi:hypothetical protein